MIAARERGVPRSGVRVRDGLEAEVATVPSSPRNKTNGEDDYHGDKDNTDVLELLPKRGEDVDMDFVREALKVVV
jgi:hypothetical protein